jgi:hypothetical protein
MFPDLVIKYHPSISMTHYYSDNTMNYKNNDKTPFDYNIKRADFEHIHTSNIDVQTIL